MVDFLGGISLTESPAPYIIYATMAIAVVAALLGLRRSIWRVVVAFLVGAAGAGVCWYILEVSWKPFPDRIPWQIFVAGGFAFFVLSSAVLQKGRRILLSVLSVFALASAWGTFNLQFQEYPTIRSLDPRPIVQPMDYGTFASLTGPPTIDGREVGALVTVDLEATQFTHRPAVVYVPPAYFKHPDRKLPVVVLLAGNPGKPEQWFESGGADTTLEDFQQKHRGFSPIVVSVDGTGSMTANPICVDGPTEKVQTYLAKDVPAQMKAKFRVESDQQKWSIGGLSYGGTCSLQVVTNAPDSYGTFLNFSGQAEPTVGEHAKTVQQFFGGNEEAFQDINPATLLDRARGSNKYSHIHGVFVSGEKDTHAKAELQVLNEKAQNAGMSTSYSEVPGGHSYQVWRVALRESIDLAAQRGGLK